MNTTKLVRLLAEEVMEWEELGSWWVEKESHVTVCLQNDWNPLEDWNDCMGLVEKMEKKHYLFEFRINEPFSMYHASIFFTTGNRLTYGHKDKRTAICKAIAQARGIEYE